MKEYTLTPGVDLQFTATLKSVNGAAPEDITNSSHWSSSDTNVATVQTLGDPFPGLVTPVGSGSVISVESAGMWYWYGNDGQVPVRDPAIEPGPQNTYQLYYIDGWTDLSGVDTNANSGIPCWFSFPTWQGGGAVDFMRIIPQPNVPLANSWFAVQQPFYRWADPPTIVTEQGDQQTAIVDQFADGDNTVVLIQWPGVYRYDSPEASAGPFSVKFYSTSEGPWGSGPTYTMSASFVFNGVIGNPQV